MFIQPRVINTCSFDEVSPFVMINVTKASVPLTIPLVRLLECFFWGFLYMKGKHNNCPCNINNDTPGNNYMLLFVNLLPPLEELWGFSQ